MPQQFQDIKTEPRVVELLAPARNASTAMAAIDHGADAVYIGASSHGARRQAGNTVDDIARVVGYAHRFNARVYVTVNTIIYDDELSDVERLVWQLYMIGVDALIVQDMSLLEMDLPPIALHASTQCDIRTPEKARFLQDAGFSQLVLPRELALEEIAAYRDSVDVALEVFVHGALCVCYSGDCQASYAVTGRSANRGDCAQVCRFPFDLEDASGKKLVKGKYLLSLKDMNRIDYLAEMLDAGVSSFKIEGRLKDDNYVRNVVAAYSRALDAVVAASNGRYRRLSRGVVKYGFTPDLSKSFNRGYTSYFLSAPSNPGALSASDSPKWIGERVGVVVGQPGKRILDASLEKPLANGDGLGFFDLDGTFQGFRLNRVGGRKLFAATDVEAHRGAVLYRNYDKVWSDGMAGKTAVRTIPLRLVLSVVNGMLLLQASDADGVSVSCAESYEAQPAAKDQYEVRLRTLSKLGDTVFSLESFTDEAGGCFIPASLLSRIKRAVVEAMLDAYAASYRYDYRRCRTAGLKWTMGKLTRHDNIANRLAGEFYRRASGVATDVLPCAIETGTFPDGDFRVMQTRYCLRRELGACLKTKEGSRLPSPLFLVSGNNRFRLEFDCRRCGMSVIRTGRNP